jgi:hypothetical protein
MRLRVCCTEFANFVTSSDVPDGRGLSLSQRASRGAALLAIFASGRATTGNRSDVSSREEGAPEGRGAGHHWPLVVANCASASGIMVPCGRIAGWHRLFNGSHDPGEAVINYKELREKVLEVAKRCTSKGAGHAQQRVGRFVSQAGWRGRSRQTCRSFC